MRKLFRRISIFACSIFWKNGARAGNPINFIRKNWAQLLISSIAIQTIACAYGGEDPYDYSNDCDPVFDTEKFTNENYTDCEKQIVEQALIAKDLQDNLGKRDDATLEAWNEVRQRIGKIAETCDMNNLYTEGSLTSLYCSDGRTINVQK
ncbi:MAG: hypothetical protein J6W51_01215 [Fibrobacter sp.]|nr:hypothetical protein [Fibrobacter sp.]